MASRRSKQGPCGKNEARSRVAVAEQYQELAHVAAGGESSAARNAAVGNAVLAGIAAADAICCVRLGRRSASSDQNVREQAMVRAEWNERMTALREGLDLATELSAAGEGWVEADEDGMVVERVPQAPPRKRAPRRPRAG